MAPKKTKRSIDGSINAWRMIRDVLITAMSKGQLPLAIFGLILIIICVRMPSDDLSKLVFKILEWATLSRLLGYIIAILALVGWFIHARVQRRIISREIDRISDERNKLQKKLIGSKIISSEE